MTSQEFGSNRQSRRTWLKTASAASAGFWIANQQSAASTRSANEKLNLAFIGVGGRGGANLGGLKSQNLVAFCDVDDKRAKAAYEKYPQVPRFKDFRKMMDQLENKIDGVVISTPDHTHFHPAYRALQAGKHVYLEKPLAHNLWETRTLCDLAKEKKVATQLGVQRHTLGPVHRVVEIIQSGLIGDVQEVYCWVGGKRGMPGMPKSSPPVPSHLDYDLWLGPAKSMDYQPSITPYGWRFWWDYGTGEPGNWGCHILDIPFWALGLKHPTKVVGSGPQVDPLRTPRSMKSTMTFEHKGSSSGKKVSVDLHWSHLANGPQILRKLELPAKGNNTLFIGSEGMVLCGFGKFEVLPKDKFEDYKTSVAVPDSPGFYKEWIDACRGGSKATCDFEYSGPLAEAVLLANVAYRSQSQFNWDAEKLTTNSNAANELIREEYRSGWEVDA